MGTLRVLSAADVTAALPMRDAIAGMKRAYALFSSGAAVVPLRARLDVAPQEGIALFMPAFVTGQDELAVKAVTVFPRNPGRGEPVVYASVLVLDGQTGRPAALLEGTSLTAIRTGAGAGAATDLLARPESRVLAMLGSGVQARAGLEAVCTVRPIDEVRIFSPNRAHAEAMAAAMAGRGPIPDRTAVVDSPAAAVRGADIIYAATTSLTPVFDSRDLQPGAHINGVGSFTPHMQEVDEATVRRALVLVDSMESALAEAGDLIIPLESGVIVREHLHGEIGALVEGRIAGRRDAEQITFFKSVGLAVQDVIAAGIALANAEAAGLGQLVDF